MAMSNFQDTFCSFNNLTIYICTWMATLDILSFLQANKNILENALLRAIRENEAILYKEDSWGIHSDVKFFLETEWGSSWVLSSWILRVQEDFPRLTNVYPVDK